MKCAICVTMCLLLGMFSAQVAQFERSLLHWLSVLYPKKELESFLSLSGLKGATASHKPWHRWWRRWGHCRTVGCSVWHQTPSKISGLGSGCLGSTMSRNNWQLEGSSGANWEKVLSLCSQWSLYSMLFQAGCSIGLSRLCWTGNRQLASFGRWRASSIGWRGRLDS